MTEKTRGEPRLAWLDRLRGLAAVGMIVVHVTHALLRPELVDTRAYRAVDASFGLVAPAFLFCVGSSFAIAKSAPLRHRLARAGALFVLGYAMHASGLVSYLRTRDVEGLAIFFQSDILQVIALALVVLATLAWALPTRWPFVALVLAVASVLVAPVLEALPAHAMPPFVMPYVSHAQQTQFPIAPWIAYALFSAAVLRTFPRDASPRARAIAIALMTTLAFVDALTRRDPSHVVATLSVLALAASVLARIRLENKVDRALTLFGRRSLFLYVVHIPIVYGRNPWSLRALVGPTLGALACALACVAVALAMGGLAWAWDALLAKRRVTSSSARLPS